MCGICGKFNFADRAPVDRETLREMTDILEHRGPDGRGMYFGRGIGLGHRRLSIIDLSERGRLVVAELGHGDHCYCEELEARNGTPLAASPDGQVWPAR